MEPVGRRSANYLLELRERAVRMVAEVRPDDPSDWWAIVAAANRLGIGSAGPGTTRRVGTPGAVQRDAVPDPDQHVGAGLQQRLDPGHAREVAIHDP